MAKTITFTAECQERMQSVQETLVVLGGKWKVKILTILYFGETHFMELQRRVTGIGSKMLSQELRDLEVNGLIKRTVQDTRPITVQYELTTYGLSLKEIIEAMEKWGRKHRKKEEVKEACFIVADA